MKSFWKKLKNLAAGPNELGEISLTGGFLQAQMNDPISRTGLIRVVAKPLAFGAPGYILEKTEDYGPDVEDVYWLPWQDGVATVANRAAYEHKANTFFMTSTLTGCRFTRDRDLVLHVAHSAGYNSAGRTQTEEDSTSGRSSHTRRLSVSAPQHGGDIRYGGNLVGAYTRALVFGMKIQDRYSYKVLKTRPLPGTWEIIG